MLSSHRAQPRPIVTEERRPSSSSSPSSPVSPRNVRFAPVTGESRPLTRIEYSSLYWFETHAGQCAACYDPYKIYQDGKRMCESGTALAQDVALHVYFSESDEEIYSVNSDKHKKVRVEVSEDFKHVRGLLKARSRQARKAAKAPIITQDRQYSTAVQSPRKEESEARRHRYERSARDEVTAESLPKRTRSRRKHMPVIVDYADDFANLRVSERGREEQRYTTSTTRNDSVMATTGRKEYRTEVRQPEREERRRERRKTYWYS